VIYISSYPTRHGATYHVLRSEKVAKFMQGQRVETWFLTVRSYSDRGYGKIMIST
jgi:hypothetical protein